MRALKHHFTHVFCASILLSGLTLSAASLNVGVNNGGNFFPFGGPATGFAGTRYQEAYSSSLFSGPISITGIDFFLAQAGDLYGGTYQLSFSTITAGVNSLSDTNFNSNLGPNNTVFDTVTLSGAAPNILTFTGGPFSYNPANGNLLLDIQITNPVAPDVEATFEDGADNGPSTISRYDDFGNGTTGFGLVTEFDFSNSTSAPEPGTLVLLGVGLAGIFVGRLRHAGIHSNSR
jgi:hypothetical protein